jgi:hypothetical protein
MDLGAARRDVEHDAFAPRHAVVDRKPGRLLAHFPSRFALGLGPSLLDRRHDHPPLGLAFGSAKPRQFKADPVKAPLGNCFEV